MRAPHGKGGGGVYIEQGWRRWCENLSNEPPNEFLRVRKTLIILLILLLAPISISATHYLFGNRSGDWQSADRSSSGLLPAASGHPEALVRVYAARTVRWRGIFAVHCWIVVKPANAPSYTRYDYTAWGEPVRINGFAPDGRWFGVAPQTIAAADGETAARMIPKIIATIEGYAWRTYGDYRAWPGPNSNTFVTAVLASVPELQVALPPTAIGKDFPYDNEVFGRTPSGTGIRFSLGGYLGLTLGWVEGVEINLLGAVIGIDLRRPAIKLPGLGRIGLDQALGT